MKYGTIRIGKMDSEEGRHQKIGGLCNMDMAKDGESAGWNAGQMKIY